MPIVQGNGFWLPPARLQNTPAKAFLQSPLLQGPEYLACYPPAPKVGQGVHPFDLQGIGPELLEGTAADCQALQVGYHGTVQVYNPIVLVVKGMLGPVAQGQVGIERGHKLPEIGVV
jgi:hypothetical protein